LTKISGRAKERRDFENLTLKLEENQEEQVLRRDMFEHFGEIMTNIRSMLDRSKYLYREVWKIENPTSFFAKHASKKQLQHDHDLEHALEGDVVGMRATS
jgi:hypothetical protein